MRFCFLLILVSLGLCGCSSLFYYPSKDEFVLRKHLPYKPKDVYIGTNDGEQLHAWHFEAPKPAAHRAILVQFHGNAQNQTAHFLSVYSALNQGYDLLTFDYRGYGRSTGKTTPMGTVEDGMAVLRWVRDHEPQLPIVVFGQSLGGAIAMRSLEELHGEVPIHLLVLDSTFASYRSAARRVAGAHWLTWLLQPVAWLMVDNSAAPQDRLNELKPYKKIVVHGEADQIVAYRLGEDLFERLPPPKEFWSIPQGLHTDFMWREEGRYGEKFFKALAESLVAPSP